MVHKIIYISLILLLINACDKKEYSDFNPLSDGCDIPSNIIQDVSGTCCEYTDLDCNEICHGTMQVDQCNICGGDNASCDIIGCNDPNAENYDENSNENSNCIYDETLPEGWSLVWNDEFNSENLDLAKWDYQLGTGSQYGLVGWGNNEEQYYTDEINNLYFDTCDGDKNCLIIKAYHQTFESSEYTSARIKSAGSGVRTYGRIDVRAKLPSAEGTWPAIWMLPQSITYGGWPASGEIDIMEHVGCNLGTIHGSIHCSDYNHQDGTQQTSTVSNINVEEFHIYRIDWDENYIKWYVDDTIFFEYANDGSGLNSWPFDVDFYLIINLAIGGDWGGFCSFSSSSFPQSMEIDYVRIYESSN